MYMGHSTGRICHVFSGYHDHSATSLPAHRLRYGLAQVLTPPGLRPVTKMMVIIIFCGKLSLFIFLYYIQWTSTLCFVPIPKIGSLKLKRTQLNDSFSCIYNNCNSNSTMGSSHETRSMFITKGPDKMLKEKYSVVDYNNTPPFLPIPLSMLQS